jgi:superfamily II DNA or RNA helicase
MIKLYDHQIEQIQNVRAAMRRSKSVLIQSPTGSGKSIMAAAMIAAARDKGSKSLFIVPRRELVRQMADTFGKFHIPHSFVVAGYSFNEKAKTHICSTMSLVKKVSYMTPDETHHGGKALDDIIKYYKERGAWIVGLSATPVKLNGQGLDCWYDEMVAGQSVRWLIDNKWLSEYRAFSPSGIKTSGGDYAKGQLDERMKDKVIIGNAVDHYIKHANGKLNIAYCAGVASSQMTAEEFKAKGIPAAHIDGKTSDDERKRIIRAFAKRELLVLCNCELLTFGFDLASNAGMDVTVECMSDLRPTKSLALQCQKWGRVLRRKDYPALIFDHGNNIMVHGMPCEDREWTLSGKKGRGERDEATIPVRECPVCYRCHKPRPSCPQCGYVYPVESRVIEEVEGELTEIQIKKEKKKKRMEVGRARSIDDLWAIARERGYKPGWVHKQAQLKGLR